MNKKLQKLALKSTMLLASLAFILTMMVGTASAHSTHVTSAKISHGVYLGGDTMYRGGYFDLADGGNDYLLSQSHRYQLKFQPDGNLVEYDLWNYGRAIWASNTANEGATMAQMEGDGNFVIHTTWNTPPVTVFQTYTYYREYPQYSSYYSHYYSEGYKLVVQNDSNVVVYDQYGRALWAVW